MQPNGNMPGVGRPVAGAPVGNLNVKSAPVPTPPPAPKPAEPTFGNGGSVVEGKGGKKTGWILGIVVLLLIAAGGVGFGVWAMMDGNAQKDALNLQVSNLKQQNNELQDKLDNTNTGTDSGYENPIIVSSESDKSYSVYFMSSEIGDSTGKTSTVGRISIGLNDGSISGCHISRKDGSLANYTDGAEECNITGIPGEIYKVVEFGAGQDNGNDNLGFVMKDGTVYYFPLRDILDSNSLAIKGEVSVDGYVIDAVNVVVGVQVGPEEGYSYGSYVFVLDDGTYVLFDETMLK